jgi:hypothetical protein
MSFSETAKGETLAIALAVGRWTLGVVMKSALLVAALVVLAVPAHAQTADQRWEPWLGCWELAADNQRDAHAPDGTIPRASRPAAVRDGAPRVCVTRVPGGVRFETTVAGQSAIDQTIVADAVSHPLNDAECTGSQRAEWSANGLRLYQSAELRCNGDDGPRRVSGLSLMAPNATWVDIQTVAVGSRETIRARRYYRAADSPRPNRPSVVSSALTLDEVKEASMKVTPAAVEEALIQTNAAYNLTGKKLIELDDAGVPDRVIDMLVALSYPEKFVVERVVNNASGGSQTIVRDPFFAGWAFGYPYYYDSYYLSPYYYEPFGYRNVVFVDYGGGYGGERPELQPSGAGRVVDGKGYTRIHPRETVTPTSTSMSTAARTASSRGADAGGGGSSSSSSSSGSSGSSSSSSGSSSGTASSGGGYTAGSSSGDTGRTAVPR